MTTNVLGELESLQAQRIAAYESLVDRLVNDEEVDAATVEETLTAAGKTTADLRKRLRPFERQKENRAKLASFDGVDDRIAHLNEERDRLNAAFDVALKAHQAKVNGIYWELQGLHQRLHDFQALKRKLFEESRGTPLATRLGMVSWECRQLEPKRIALDEKMESLQYKLKNAINYRESIRGETGGHAAVAYRKAVAEVEQLEAAIEQHKTVVADCQQRLAALHAECERLEKAMVWGE